MYRLQEKADKEFQTDVGTLKPIATLVCDAGTRLQIREDDRCYVLWICVGGKYKLVHHIFSEAFEVLKTLPNPEEVHQVKLEHTNFVKHLDGCTETVSTWPDWKQNLLGKIYSSKQREVEQVDVSEEKMQKAFALAAADKELRAIWQDSPLAAKKENTPDDNLKELQEENKQLRKIISECASAIGNGSFCGPEASVGFMSGIPEEIKLVVNSLKKGNTR